MESSSYASEYLVYERPMETMRRSMQSTLAGGKDTSMILYPLELDPKRSLSKEISLIRCMRPISTSTPPSQMRLSLVSLTTYRLSRYSF